MIFLFMKSNIEALMGEMAVEMGGGGRTSHSGISESPKMWEGTKPERGQLFMVEIRRQQD